MSAAISIQPGMVAKGSTGGAAQHRYRWPLIVCGLLVGHLSLMSWAVVKATGDRNGSQVIPNYYEKALAWDQTRAEQARSDALGWQSEMLIDRESVGDLTGRRATFQIRDIGGAAVVADSVELTYAHETGPLSAEATVKLGAADKDGGYTADLRIVRPGFHRFELRVRRGKDLYIRSWSEYVPAALPQ